MNNLKVRPRFYFTAAILLTKHRGHITVMLTQEDDHMTVMLTQNVGHMTI